MGSYPLDGNIDGDQQEGAGDAAGGGHCTGRKSDDSEPKLCIGQQTGKKMDSLLYQWEAEVSQVVARK